MNLESIYQAENLNNFKEAADLYEEWLRNHPDDRSSAINLAVLYWYVTDFGVHSTRGLSLDFVKKASVRSRELLDRCIAESADPEAIFWRMYFDCIDWDRDITSDVKQLLKDHPDCLIPHLLLVLQGIESIQCEVISKLRSSQERSRTTKARYIRSVLESCATNG